MLERLFGISSLIDFNHECDCGFAMVRVWLAHILARDSIEQLEISIPAAFHHMAAKLRFAVWIFEVNYGDGNPRVAGGIAGLYRTLVCADDEMIVLATDPNWRTVRRAIAHDGCEVGKVAAVN